MADAAPVVAVIGAGPAGLATLKALADVGVPAKGFDAGERVGGLWAFGGPHSSAYRTLHLNTSRGRTEFADFPMPTDWPDYPDHTRIASYLQEYADRYDLTDRVALRHTVDRVEQLADGRWAVTATGPDGTATEVFAAVVVANGHNSRPRMAVYPGTPAVAELHSHDYRDPSQLAGKRVLVVGGGNSAMDIAVDASHVAERTLLSLRRGVWIVPKHLLGKPSDTLNGALAKRLPWRVRQVISQTMLRLTVGSPTRYGLPEPEHGFLQDHPTLSDALLSRLSHGEIDPRPGIERIDSSVVTFVDGTREQVDLIVWCTGYRIDLPFLDPALLGPGADRLPLYRRIFHLDAPGLMFVGLMQSTGAALPVVEAQARLVAGHLAGAYALPTRAEQAADCDAVLRAATQRWGDRRPAMRIDFDAYLELAARELRDGARRRDRGRGITWPSPPTRPENSSSLESAAR
ncbi:cation diffusion facilitator CzcD-associated flavoprotein CzcO [Allocatelliglobosispora scoriae]|uniref:Cation diffusion facilitator CzcD-associated flavoprotein CzcO n=1 Tax=Allocatelliglobosispora scoriae TaxID=643052 RepID=A0A841BNH8_9ACTN|nr:NAD(P)-binding domain-containing protein [Allocatelliglobosispora scoriae]MBB5868846.1 cation diffusion facilitator CzcD-associated flavoprotein CzcO [Allocatelliglobosispora scoriae]